MNRMKAAGARAGSNGLQSAVFQDDDGTVYFKTFSVYVADIAAVSEGASGSGSITIQSDSDFVIQQITGCAQLVDKTYITSPIASVQITDTGSAFNLFSAAVMWVNIFGTAQLPFILPVPRLVKANAKVNITINCLEEGASDNNYQIAFVGHRLNRLSNNG